MDLPRQTALDILIAWDREGSYPNLLLKEKLNRLADQRERGFCTNIVYGTVENKLKLDHFISSVSSVPLRKIHVVNRNILRMGLYQGLFLNVPVSAACNTSVELAKKNGQFRSSGFVNAILRKLLSAPEKLLLPQGRDAESLSIRYSVDASIVQLLAGQYSNEFVSDYFEALDQLDPDQSHIAVNLLKTDAEMLEDALKNEGVEVLERSPELLTVHFSANPSALKSFQNGWFHVIGKPSFITAEKLNVVAGECVLDLCSAPGGKTFALAYKMKNTGRIIAADIYPHKIEMMKLQAKRLGLTNIEFVCADASALQEAWIGKADKVLCDVPCSGLGIIRKKPDIRYKNMNEFSLYETQKKILENGLQYLKVGGKLVYSTCTVNPAENQNIPALLHADVIEEKTFLPQIDQTEGFYYAVISSETKND